jgi:hypothetical protein
MHQLPYPKKVPFSLDSGPNGQKQSQENDCVPEQSIQKSKQLRKRTEKNNDGR